MANQLPLRLAFIALFTCCDREGRFRWQPRHLKLHMLPYDEVDIFRVLDALVAHGFIVKYERNGEFYGCIPSWLRHQNINNKEQESILPALEDPKLSVMEGSMPFHSENPSVNNEIIVHAVPVHDTCITRELRVCEVAFPVPRGREDKGREEKVKEVEGNGMEKKREEDNIIIASKTRPRSAVDDPIHQIFEHWKTVMRHPHARLDPKRKALIRKALKLGYSVEQLYHAIMGCSVTPHNIGDNDRNQRYDGLHVILRDADQIDRFIHHYHTPPRPTRETDRRTEANVQTLQRWMDKKMCEEQNRAH
jgi:hypothetical protein